MVWARDSGMEAMNPVPDLRDKTIQLEKLYRVRQQRWSVEIIWRSFAKLLKFFSSVTQFSLPNHEVYTQLILSWLILACFASFPLHLDKALRCQSSSPQNGIFSFLVLAYLVLLRFAGCWHLGIEDGQGNRFSGGAQNIGKRREEHDGTQQFFGRVPFYHFGG